MPGFPAARATDYHGCPAFTPALPPVPHAGGPIMPPCSMNTIIGGLPAARLGDFAICTGPFDVVFKGASSVLINNLPAARLTDTTAHGGVIVAPGAPTVLIGDPAFALPPNITVGGDPAFQNKTIRDLYLISTTPSGAALLARLGASGESVDIVPTNVANGYTTPSGLGIRRWLGWSTGSVIQYNPDLNLTVLDSGGMSINEPPPIALGHELCHALHNAEGTHKSGTDPARPALEPDIPEEEAQTIGVGSHTGQSPSENSLRHELGLPPRGDHSGWESTPGDPPPLNLRPGG